MSEGQRSPSAPSPVKLAAALEVFVEFIPIISLSFLIIVYYAYFVYDSTEKT